MPFNANSVITNKQVRGYFLDQQKPRLRTSIARKICQVVPQYSETEYFANMGAIENLSEVDKDFSPVSGDVPEWQYSVKLKCYKLAKYIPTSLFKFDQIGQVRGYIADAATRAYNLDDYLLASVLTGGTTATSFLYNGADATNTDYGHYFFSTTHTMGGSSGNQSNLITGNTPTSLVSGVSTLSPTVAQYIWTDLNNAYTALNTFTDNAAMPYEQHIPYEDCDIICGPLMAQVFRFAFQSQFVLQTDNAIKNAVGNIHVSNFLPSSSTDAGSTDWYLVHRKARKPAFLIHEFTPRTAAEMQDPPRTDGATPITPGSIEVYSTFENPNDHWVQTTEHHAFWVKRWMTLGYGEWSSVVKVENSAS